MNSAYRITLYILVIVFGGYHVLASSEGIIDANYKYVWGNYLGWLNFGCDNCNVRISDDRLSGYVWSENFGWINLSPENGGVKNDGEGNLSGYAWGENIGWLNFSGVKINEEGKFFGKITTEKYGEISFECNYCEVRTNWRPKRARVSVVSQIGRIFGGGGGATAAGGIIAPIAPPGGFSVVINNNDPYTYEKIVDLTLNGGDVNTYEMAISNFADFRDAKKEPYQRNKKWDLCKGIDNCRIGRYTVYVRFFTAAAKDYSVTSTIGASIVVSDDIFYIQRGEPTLLPTILSKTSPLIQKTENIVKKMIPIRKSQKQETPVAVASVNKNEKAVSIFDRDWRLLTYTKQEGNLIEFVSPELVGEIRRLLVNFQEPREATLFGFLALANILDILMVPFKSIVNFLITLFIVLVLVYFYRVIKAKNRFKGHDSLIIQK